MTGYERSTYTVADLIATLQECDPGDEVVVISGCHECGGEHVEIEQSDGAVVLIGHTYSKAAGRG